MIKSKQILSSDIDDDNEACINVMLKIYTSILPANDEVDENRELCTCVPQPDIQSSLKESEIIPNVKVKVTPDSKIQLKELLFVLKKRGYPLTSSIVYYFNIEIEDKVLAGCDPILSTIYIPIRNYKSFLLQLDCYCFVDDEFIKDIMENLKHTTDQDNTNMKRTKERKIGYIIEKVNSWRRLYNGFFNEENEFIKYSLDDAAKIIKISKKSLDDYLLQLRLGRKFGFDFNACRHMRVGVLRNYIKNQKLRDDESVYR